MCSNVFKVLFILINSYTISHLIEYFLENDVKNEYIILILKKNHETNMNKKSMFLSTFSLSTAVLKAI